MVGRDGGQKFRGQPEGKALKATRMPEILFPCASLSSCQGKLSNNIDLYAVDSISSL